MEQGQQIGGGYSGQIASGGPTSGGRVTNTDADTAPKKLHGPGVDPNDSNATDVPGDEAKDSLGMHVRQMFQQAYSGRDKIDELLLQCLRQRRGEYDPDELALIAASTATFFNITATKCRAGEAWLTDILTASGDRLWQIDPTPLPNLPDFIKQQIVQQVKLEVLKYGNLPEDVVRERIGELAEIAHKLAMDHARQGTDRMQQKIDDQLEDAHFIAVLQAFVSDLLVYPYAVLKAPVPRRTTMLQWVGGEVKPQQTTSLMVDRVSPFDYYWAPWATSPQEGFNIEVMHLTRQVLHDCIDMPNFDSKRLRQALQDYESGHSEQVRTRTVREQLEWQTMRTLHQGDNIDVLDFWGSVQGNVLTEWGVKVDDTDAQYEVNAWVVGSLCVRAVLNPDPLKRRPFYVTSYEKVPGSMVGRSVSMLMRPNQQIINSAYRALRRNMGIASGPFTEVDQSRLGGQQAPNEIAPAMVKVVEPDLSGTGKPAYTFHKIDSHAQELETVIDTEIKKCDDATGIPAYAYGNPQIGGAGRTVGGLAMLMGNSAKGIKKVVVNIEQDVLEPMITAFYNYNMLFDSDKGLKIDAQVSAKGPTNVLAKETASQRRMEALQIVGPYVPTGIIPKDGLAILLRETLKGLDLPVDDIIPDPKLQQQLQQLAGGQQGGPPGAPPQGPPGAPPAPQGQPGVPPPQPGIGAPAQPPYAPHLMVPPGMPGSPQPAPDGRSGPAQAMVHQLASGHP